ncbi:MAG: FAD-dependent oxidoreductase [Gammaproteobacteria bacterium]
MTDRVPVALALLLLLTSCTQPGTEADYDVIVVGAGIAGLSAALEASQKGQSVLVLDANSVGGGHAVKAGGFALVGTPLQAKKGYVDSPEIAARDLLAWGEDADPDWVRRYVTESRTEVHDWLANFGVRWTFILDTPEHSVPRFHFAGGSALNVVVPMMQAAFADPRLTFYFNNEVVSLQQSNGRINGVQVRDTRTGTRRQFSAPAVIIATGGWQGNLDFVRRAWRTEIPAPDHLYSGAGYFATGSGIALAQQAGAATTRMDHQVTFTTGLPDPQATPANRALLSQNPAAIWVNSKGQRFINELGPSKVADETILKMSPTTHWLIFDADGLRSLRIRDAVWLGNPGSIDTLKTAGLIRQAPSIAALAEGAGLPPDALATTVARWNEQVASGEDTDFNRFSAGHPDRSARKLDKAPWYALQLFPMTRKSMGGLAIDQDARVTDRSGQVIPGLYAAGEVTGVAGINGSYGGEGTFLGPSVLLGRIAGRSASRAAGSTVGDQPVVSSREPGASGQPAATMTADTLRQMVALQRPGFWHFEMAHRIVLERKLDCLACHSPAWPTRSPTTSGQRQLQLKSCASCH